MKMGPTNGKPKTDEDRQYLAVKEAYMVMVVELWNLHRFTSTKSSTPHFPNSKMAEFGNLSDTDDSAVDELVSQIQDLSVLEQVSKINTCSFSGSLLPSHLDTRFQRLKSLPNPISSKPPNGISDPIDKINPVDADDPLNFSTEENPDGKKEEKESKQDQFLLSPKLESGSFDSPLDWSISSMDSPSPPRKSGCFWCSPKKMKKKEKRNLDWGKKEDEEFRWALSSFSVKEQEKILKKAMKEEERINREADKIVKWAKQASNKFDF